MSKFRNTLFWKNYKKFDKVVGNSSMRSPIDALIYWELFKEYNFSNILEIGVYQGLTAGLMLESSSLLESYTGIDTNLRLDLFNEIWTNYLTNTKFYEQSSQEFNYSKTYDFILIDGDHSYNGALTDLMKTSKLLSKNGVLAIDDYSMPEVAIAVSEFKKHTELVPFLQTEQTEFWHYPNIDRSKFLDGLLINKINNFIFLYNIDNNQILKAKTSMIFTDQIDFTNQVLEFYDI
jgi:hypothetical protein